MKFDYMIFPLCPNCGEEFNYSSGWWQGGDAVFQCERKCDFVTVPKDDPTYKDASIWAAWIIANDTGKYLQIAWDKISELEVNTSINGKLTEDFVFKFMDNLRPSK